MESHLLQMRGLKHKWLNQREEQYPVASFTDAWIETLFEKITEVNEKSHLLQMRGLKHLISFHRWKVLSRIFYRCVD